jgi:hypothetical protein
MSNGIIIAITGIISFIFGYVVGNFTNSNQPVDLPNIMQEERTATGTNNRMEDSATTTRGSSATTSREDSELGSGDPDETAFTIAVVDLPKNSNRRYRWWE